MNMIRILSGLRSRIRNRGMRALPWLALATAVGAQPPPSAASLLSQNTHPFTYTATTLGGPGADLLRTRVARSQFVLLGEAHMDHAVPIFAGALYRLLHSDYGFRHLVVEQDPVAIEEALAPEVRGDVERIAGLAKRYPSLFEFGSDEDLTLLADVGRLEPGPDAIWGVEQTTGAIRYLEELIELAPSAAVRREVEARLAEARAADPGPAYTVNWLAGATTVEQVTALAAAFDAQPDSRAAYLLRGLAKSAEIFGYYLRAEAGEFVGLYNNTVREEVLKGHFLTRYRAVAARTGENPKALFKFGANHLYHGKNPTQAFPIGNLAHELAIFNGSVAYGLIVLPLGPGYRSYADYPAWMRTLFPAVEPTTPTLIDLTALRPYQRLFRDAVEPADLWQQRALLHGYDAIVLLPGSRPSSQTRGGRGPAESGR